MVLILYALPNVHKKSLLRINFSVDNTDTGRSTSPELPLRTLNYACAQTFADSTNFKTIKVSTGTYTEQLPIRVGRKTAIIGDNLRSVTVSPDTTTDNGDGAGISSDGSTPNNRQTMFRLNDSCTLSGMTFSGGVTGQLQVRQVQMVLQDQQQYSATATGKLFVLLTQNRVLLIHQLILFQGRLLYKTAHQLLLEQLVLKLMVLYITQVSNLYLQTISHRYKIMVSVFGY